jgi:hypothetical protein
LAAAAFGFFVEKTFNETREALNRAGSLQEWLPGFFGGQ